MKVTFENWALYIILLPYFVWGSCSGFLYAKWDTTEIQTGTVEIGSDELELLQLKELKRIADAMEDFCPPPDAIDDHGRRYWSDDVDR